MADNRPLNSESFGGIVAAITNVIATVSGLGTASFTLSPSGYPESFGGIVSALEDLNVTLSGIEGGSSNIVGGSGIYITSSGFFSVVNTTLASVSGATYTAGSGLYLREGIEFNIDYNQAFQNTVSGHVLAEGSNTIIPSGNYIVVSGVDVSSINTYTAGETLASGDFVCFNGGSLVKASAASGVDSALYNPIGSVVAPAVIGNPVRINSDNIVTIADSNITADTELVPGQNYYLSKYAGQITQYSTASGEITLLTGGYGALVYVGRALSATQLEVEIQPKILLTE